MFSRRDLILAGLAGTATLLGGCSRRLIKPPRCDNYDSPDGAVIVDAHCHIFNASDLQVAGFINQVKLKTPDISPLSIIGHLVQSIGWTIAPSAEEELNWLKSIKRSEPARPRTLLAPASYATALSSSIEGAGQTSDERFSAFWKEAYARDSGAVTAFSAEILRQHPIGNFAPSLNKPVSLAAAMHEGDVQQFIISMEQASSFTGASILTFLKTFFRFRTENAWTMMQSYGCDTSPGLDLLCPALVDFDLWLSDSSNKRHGATESSLKSQLALMKEISLATNGRVHAIAPFNPLRSIYDSSYLAQMESAVHDGGCVAFKLYPPMGFAPSANEALDSTSPAPPPLPKYRERQATRRQLDRSLTDFYEMCTGIDAPIMAHASPSNAAFSYSKELGSPENWVSTLQSHPKLRVSLGHMGGDHSLTKDSAWRREIVELMRRFPGQVFADLSFYDHVLGGPESKSALGKQLDFLAHDQAAGSSVMYGSDWSMLAAVSKSDRYLAEFHSLLSDELKLSDGMRKGILGENAVRFYGLDVDGAGSQRLRRFHGPAWTPASAALG